MGAARVESDDMGMMLVSCVRYALGRRTYIVGMTCEWVRRFWPWVDAEKRAVIARDIAECTDRGHDCDEKEWRALMDFIAASSAEGA